MASFNQVTLLGNLTRDPQVKHVGSSSVAEFGIAVNRKYKTAQGEAREEVLFVDCSAWGKTGEIINQYCQKGKSILVSGRLKYDAWEKDGQKRSKLSVIVENFQFIGGAGDRKSEQGDGDEHGQEPAPAGIKDDDIPF